MPRQKLQGACLQKREGAPAVLGWCLRLRCINQRNERLCEKPVVRTFSRNPQGAFRKGRWKRVITTPYPSLQAAWPMIRATVKTRLRHRYRIIESG